MPLDLVGVMIPVMTLIYMIHGAIFIKEGFAMAIKIKFFPFEKKKIILQRSIQQIVETMENEITSDKGKIVSKINKSFKGAIGRNGFKISRIPSYNRGLNLIFKGSFIKLERATQIDITIRFKAYLLFVVAILESLFILNANHFEMVSSILFCYIFLLIFYNYERNLFGIFLSEKFSCNDLLK